MYSDSCDNLLNLDIDILTLIWSLILVVDIGSMHGHTVKLFFFF